MLKKIKKSIDTIFRFVLSLNETKRNETNILARSKKYAKGGQSLV